MITALLSLSLVGAGRRRGWADRGRRDRSRGGRGRVCVHGARRGGVAGARRPRRNRRFRVFHVAKDWNTMIMMRFFLPLPTSRLNVARAVVAAGLGTALIASCGVDQAGLGTMPFLPHDASSADTSSAGVAGASGNPGVAGSSGTGGGAGSVPSGIAGTGGSSGVAGTGGSGVAGVPGTAGTGGDAAGAAGTSGDAGTSGAAGAGGVAGTGGDGAAGTGGSGAAGVAGTVGTAGTGGSTAGTGGDPTGSRARAAAPRASAAARRRHRGHDRGRGHGRRHRGPRWQRRNRRGGQLHAPELLRRVLQQRRRLHSRADGHAMWRARPGVRAVRRLPVLLDHWPVSHRHGVALDDRRGGGEAGHRQQLGSEQRRSRRLGARSVLRIREPGGSGQQHDRGRDGHADRHVQPELESGDHAARRRRCRRRP